MITAITVLNRKRCQPLLEEMFRLRARIFGDRLGWNVEVRDGKEMDRFDELEPAYLVGLDEEGRVVSCARLLQTTGAHMLADVYAAIMGKEPPLRSPLLWEATRFCVDTERLGTGERMMQAYCELAAGVIAFARQSGVEDIIAVGDPVLARSLRRADRAAYTTLGQPIPMGETSALASVIDCTPERVERLQAFAGLSGPALVEDHEALAALTLASAERSDAKVIRFRGRGTTGPLKTRPTTPREIVDYCLGRIQTAPQPKERLAALVALDKVLGSAGGEALLDEMGPALVMPVVDPGGPSLSMH